MRKKSSNETTRDLNETRRDLATWDERLARLSDTDAARSIDELLAYIDYRVIGWDLMRGGDPVPVAQVGDLPPSLVIEIVKTLATASPNALFVAVHHPQARDPLNLFVWPRNAAEVLGRQMWR